MDMNLSLMTHPPYQDTNGPRRTGFLRDFPQIICLSSGTSHQLLTSPTTMVADVIAMFSPFSAPLSMFRSLTFASSRNDHAQNHSIPRMGSTP